MLDQRILTLLERRLRPRTKLVLSRPQDWTPVNCISSHLNGTPYFEAGHTWPRNPDTGKPLTFIFQIFNDGSLQLPQHWKLAQFFYDVDDLRPATSDEEGGYHFRIYESPSPEKFVGNDDPAPRKEIKCQLISYREDRNLPDWDEVCIHYPSLHQACLEVSPEDPGGVYRAHSDALIGDQDFGSWIGGHPLWLQNPSHSENFLFQFDSTESFPWGDSGLLYFFLEDEASDEIRFELQSM